MNNLITFNFNQNSIRIESDQNQTWFCLKDICDVLDIKDRHKLRQRLNERGMTLIPTPSKGGKQMTYYVNEPNLYRAILKSDKPEAIEFENWICEEVLPAIRKTGEYKIEERKPTFAETLLGSRELKKVNQELKALNTSLQAELLKSNSLWRNVRRYTDLGLTNAEISKLIGKAPRTVKYYKTKMRRLSLLAPKAHPVQLVLEFKPAVSE